MDVNLDVPGLYEPATGRLVSMPERRRPVLNDVAIQAGRYPAIGRPDEVIISEAFAEANGLTPGDRIGAVINGRQKALHVVGIGLSPEYVYEVQGTGFHLPGQPPLRRDLDVQRRPGRGPLTWRAVSTICPPPCRPRRASGT